MVLRGVVVGDVGGGALVWYTYAGGFWAVGIYFLLALCFALLPAFECCCSLIYAADLSMSQTERGFSRHYAHFSAALHCCHSLVIICETFPAFIKHTVKAHSYWLHLCPHFLCFFSFLPSKTSTGVSVYDRIKRLTAALADLSPLVSWWGSDLRCLVEIWPGNNFLKTWQERKF